MTVQQLIKKLEKIEDKKKEVVILTENLDFKVATDVEQTEIWYTDMTGTLLDDARECVRIR